MFRSIVTALLVSISVLAGAQLPEPNGGPLERGVLPLQWAPSGPKCMEVPDWQVHEYNPNFYIIRQSGCTDYEKPFVYLLFGKERALVLDTGSRNGRFTPMLQQVVHNWLLRNQRPSIEVVVTHSHSHSDHVAGDAEIQALQDPAMPIIFVAATVAALQNFYGIARWPANLGQVDLGERVLDVIPLPGHDEASIALYDRNTGVLLTGDSLYPGRLYIHDLDAFTQSTQRLIHFSEGKLITHILGCHVEQTRTPFLDYAIGTIYQPDEHELALSRGALLELGQVLTALNGEPRKVALRDFSLWPVRAQALGMRPEVLAAFKQVQEEQKKRMWNQSDE